MAGPCCPQGHRDQTLSQDMRKDISSQPSLYGLKGTKKEPNAPKEMPFKASRRHEIWTVDIGKHWEPSQLDRIFYSTRFQRRLNKHGTTLDSDIGDSMASWG